MEYLKRSKILASLYWRQNNKERSLITMQGQENNPNHNNTVSGMDNVMYARYANSDVSEDFVSYSSALNYNQQVRLSNVLIANERYGYHTIMPGCVQNYIENGDDEYANFLISLHTGTSQKTTTVSKKNNKSADSCDDKSDHWGNYDRSFGC